ncbi:MAG: cation:proton antiporter [Thermoleophilaceae bacterium]|nr:cation:proton antiporter [Thermoleophilaceae bacterium]
MVDVDSGSFLIIVAAGALAALAGGLLPGWAQVPTVVIEVLAGILIGPDLLGLAEPDRFIEFFASLGLGMLFFFAGYEIDFVRIRGTPLRLGALGWLMSLALAFALAGLLSLTGLVISFVFTGAALATTAIGTLLPILRDADTLRSRLGTHLLAAGAVGEFGPVLLITFVFSTKSTVSKALILLLFIAVAVVAALVAVRGVGRGWALFERTLEASGQPAIRFAVVVVFACSALAASLGLDVLLGGFVAGVIVRLALQGREVRIFESKLTALGYGFLIPFFFIVSGLQFNLDALLSSPGRLLEVPLFLALFLFVRGVPALVVWRGVLDRSERSALALFSATQLPLVVAITTIAVGEGHMRSATAASLVGAAILSTMIFPVLALRVPRVG